MRAMDGRWAPTLVLIVLFVGLEGMRQRPHVPAAVQASETFCVVVDEGSLQARHCADPAAALVVAPRQVREALGAPVCWDTADAESLTSVAGVGPALAERLVVWRDAGGVAAAEGLEAVSGIGPSLARRVASSVQQGCDDTGSGWGGGATGGSRR